jgi:molybdopterin converting factor small subunit
MDDAITVEVRLSGRLAGGGPRRVRLPAGATAGDLVIAVAPALDIPAERLAGVAVAIGGEIAGRDRPLADGEAISLVVPVAGGG